MIPAAVVCPGPPLMFAELSGAEDVAARLRAVCVATLTAALTEATPARVCVVGGASTTRAWDPGTGFALASYSPQAGRRTGRTEGDLPLSLAVGRHLLALAGWEAPVSLQAVAWQAPPDDLGRVAGGLAASPDPLLLVVGEGSARRGERAPGHLDERAFGYDEELTRALRTGDAPALATLDGALARELMVSGWSAFGVLAEVAREAGGVRRSELLRAEDPFGVLYLVARWALGRPG